MDPEDEVSEQHYTLPFFERYAHRSFLKFFPFLPTYNDKLYEIDCDCRKRVRRWKKLQRRKKLRQTRPGPKPTADRRMSVKPNVPPARNDIDTPSIIVSD